MASERVLLVTDGSESRRVVADCLRRAGYEVVDVSAGMAAGTLRREHFDLVVAPVEGLIEQLRLRSLAPLAQITTALVTESSLATIASALLREVRRDSNAQITWLVLTNDSALLETSGDTSLEPKQLAELARLLLKRFPRSTEPRTLPLPGVAAGEQRTVARGGDRWPEEAARWLQHDGVDQIVLLPLVAKGKRIGAAFAAGRAKTMRAGAADLRFLAVLGTQAGIAIENARLYRQARTMSLTDAPSGLPNARFLRDHLPVLLAQARRGRRPLSMLFIDSDSLKMINDHYGHDAGNQFVVWLANIIRRGARARRGEGRIQGVRSSDVVVRYTSGDEFIVLMPDTDAAQAQVVAERLRTAVALAPFPSGKEDVACSVSIGTATFPDDATSAEALIRCADQAMYEAKRRGKNRVIAYTALRQAEVQPATLLVSSS